VREKKKEGWGKRRKQGKKEGNKGKRKEEREKNEA